MILSAQSLRSIGWLALLAVCGALVMILSFRVNSVRSQVHRAEVQIVALKQQKMYLETEFETRANQQQLKAWNDLEFGYVAPTAGQYLENERQLAVLSKPAEPDAPAPIRVATVDDSVIAAAAFPAMAGDNGAVRKLAETHEAEAEDSGPGKPAARTLDHASAAATLAEKLGTLHAPARAADSDRKADAPRKVAAAVAKTGSRPEKAEKHDKPGAKKVATVEKARAKPSREADARTKKAAAGKTTAAKAPAKAGTKVARKDSKTGVKTSR